jgi:hypothetical protein
MGGVDPTLTPRWWDNPALVRESPAVRSFRYYVRVNPTLDIWTEYPFLDQGRTGEGFESVAITVVNDAANPVDFSFDGVTVHGTLYAGEALVNDARRERHIYLKNNVALSASIIRIWAW